METPHTEQEENRNAAYLAVTKWPASNFRRDLAKDILLQIGPTNHGKSIPELMAHVFAMADAFIAESQKETVDKKREREDAAKRMKEIMREVPK